MGKGGTKFVGDAIPDRTGKGRATYSNKELRQNMDVYLKTGQHPDEIKSKQQQQNNNIVPILPQFDASRPLVYVDIQLQDQTSGRIVIELFTDLVPTAALLVNNRCQLGNQSYIKGCYVDKIEPDYAIYFGNHSRPGGSKLAPSSKLRHSERGVVGVELDGRDMVIALGRHLALDATHQAVGRVFSGDDVLSKLVKSDTNHLRMPEPRIQLTGAGNTTVHGQHSLDNDEQGMEQQISAEQASAQVRNTLQAQFGNKRAAQVDLSQAQQQKARKFDAFIVPQDSDDDDDEVDESSSGGEDEKGGSSKAT